jgi:hypothetical protein
MKRTALLLAACLVALPLHAADPDRKDDAHRKSVKSETTTVKTTVEAIDHANRTVTVREKDGDRVTLYAGPDVQGFDTLNVGDKVTFRYTEPVALRLSKVDEHDTDRPDRTGTTTSGTPYGSQPEPGRPTDQPGAPGGGSGSGAASPSGSTTGSATGTPAGMMAEQVTALVTVKDVDTKDQSITFETEDGQTVSARVDDGSLVKDIDPGDQIEITYTNPMLLSVEK